MLVPWQQQFPALLQRFLSRYFAGQSSRSPELFASISQLSNAQKRGIFEFVYRWAANSGRREGLLPNTWVKQFSEAAPCRSEIQELVREVVVTRGEEVREAIQVFVARHPDKQFNLRQLQQVFNIAKYRTKAEDASEARSEGSEGFSVSIDQCLLFQTACGMQE
ncbi:Hypothetical_protein [Hexamita inflata]|uniref:Hypothetical_protein n=1 Tax=Hexamita inflata TaxID=28002 RepID=A0AA86NZC8_9EUKA|nr:Hypothetical protein HINF_LOCUS15833 [Hexamita inflata]